MKSTTGAVAIAAALLLAGTAHAQQHSLADDAKAFGARPSVSAPDLSADGNQIVYITPGTGRSMVAVVGDLNSGKFNQLAAANGAPERLTWCRFASSSRFICQAYALTKLANRDMAGFTRLISMNAGGADAKVFGQRSSDYDASLRQYGGDIIDWLGGSQGKVLLQDEYVPEEGKMGTRFVNTKSGLGVDIVDATSGAKQSVEDPRPHVSGYLSDGRGDVRLIEYAEYDRDYPTGRYSYGYRTPGSKSWTPLIDFQRDQFQPLAIDATSNRLYALKKDATGHWSLYTIALDAGKAETLVASNPKVDIDNIVRVGTGQKVIGYTFSEDQRSAVYFDPDFKNLSASLSKALPNLPLVDFVDSSADGNKLLIFAGSDKDPGRYYLFDRAAKSLTPEMVERPELEGRQLASVTTVNIPVSDGTSMLAYLTLPPGKGKTNLPTIVLPHGGPSARDEWGFDWLAQFLAARGYAVLQPEFRGSAGFGDAWLNENGFKNWRTSIGDITAGTKWLKSQGIANPDKIAILGWSYGGYAALQSAAVEPSLYKGVIAIAPVTDLAMLKQESVGYTNRYIIEKEIGSGPHIVEGSPLQHARDIKVPVLLFHADNDANVAVAESQKMDAALRSAGDASQLIVFDGLDHQIDDSDARAQMLSKIGEFLDAAIGK